MPIAQVRPGGGFVPSCHGSTAHRFITPAPRPHREPDREGVTSLAVIVEESEVCGLRVISAAELQRAGTRLLSCVRITPTLLANRTGHYLALSRTAGTVIVVIDERSSRAKPVYMHNGDVDPLDIKAIEQCIRAGVYPKAEEEDRDE
jgi:hypothetical protein